MKKIRWFDRNGAEIFEGDTLRCVCTGREERVYECHPEGCPDEVSLGLNASNEKFLELHPDWSREIYPFSGLFHEIRNGKRYLVEYVKVV